MKLEEIIAIWEILHTKDTGEIFAIWEILHTKDTGEISFADLDRAIEGVESDV